MTTLSSIRTNLIMDSHEEKVADALKEAKEQAAKKDMDRRAKEIKDRQMAQLRQNLVSGQGLGTGMGPSRRYGRLWRRRTCSRRRYV